MILVALAAALGQFEAHADLGISVPPGRTTYNAVSQEYTLSPSGTTHIVWRRIKGNFILQASVEPGGENPSPDGAVGIVIRNGIGPESSYAGLLIGAEGLVSIKYRMTTGGILEEGTSSIARGEVLQIEREGDTYHFSAARHGDPLTTRERKDFLFGDEVFVGLQTDRPAVFRNVRLIRPAPPDFVPYRDYIGSHLEVVEVASGRRQILYSSPEPFEAPNWTPDGAALIYNGSGSGESRGRLYRFDLLTRQPAPIDTGFAIRNNNDHVLSFDGKMLGISDQSAEGGQSIIYTLPASGGAPKRITALAPSYLHGWSPDGKYLVYAGNRNGDMDIYRIASDGSGRETRLTNTRGVDDGPEYSPDGEYIYFNSARSGKMQIWRMTAEGRNPQRITHDEFNNWFPHVSPDGKWLAMLSYGDDVEPGEHPYYKRVYIRVMPVEGGPARVVAYVYGGQGTMNVPSWSPDSKMLAFVSNDDLD